MRARAAVVLVLGLALTIALPILGLSLAGEPIAHYFDFPPRTEQVAHASFSWSAFALYAFPFLVLLALYGVGFSRARPARQAVAAGRFPWWGWLGVALIACGWSLAWSRGIVPEGWQRHAFTPLWLGYILVINGAVFRRTGRSPVTHHTRLLLLLFPASAVFWWVFEYLNQFVDSWHYAGTDAEDDVDYFLQATLPFSTVLPGVFSTWHWLRSMPRIEATNLPPLLLPNGWTDFALALGIAALLAIGLVPQALFSMLWLGPLLILLGLQQRLLGTHLLSPLASGDWRPFVQPALAALVCGFFWELWNFGSVAKWHYSIPYANRFHLFEMPILGYAGYIPFGLECAVVVDLVSRLSKSRWHLDNLTADSLYRGA
jgi:hypothetical protein